MRESGGIAIASLLMMRLSASVAEKDPTVCERVLVEIAAGELESETHSGRFYDVGEGMEFKSLYRSEGNYLLQFITEDDQYYTYQDPLTPEELSNEPDDVTLDVDEDPRVDRRVLAECGSAGTGFWVIGLKGEGDIAMHPMIKVSDCAEDPTEIDGDSVWFRQQCNECEKEEIDGEVTISLEEYPCDSFSFPPTPAPEPVTIVDPDSALGVTPAPVTTVDPDSALGVTPAPVTTVDPDSARDGEEGEDGAEDGPDSLDVDDSTASDDTDAAVQLDEDGASKAGGLRVGLGVAVSALGVAAANVFANAMQC